MSTPVINAVENVNDNTLDNLFQAISDNQAAIENISQSDRNIDAAALNNVTAAALSTNAGSIIPILCRRENRDPTNFASLSDVVGDVPLVQDLAARQSMTNLISQSPDIDTEFSSNDRAAREMMCSPAGLDATTFTDVNDVASDSTAMSDITSNNQAIRSMASISITMNAVAGSQTAMDIVSASQTAMEHIAERQRAMDIVSASQTAMDTIAASQTAMDAVIESQTAMDAVIESQTALDAVAASQTAMESMAASQTATSTIAESQTAIDTIGSNANENITENTMLNSSTATSAFQNSSLKQTFSANFGNAFNAAGTLTNSRVLVTSNNDEGDEGVDIDFANDAGTEIESGSTFIINSASKTNGPSSNGGSVEFDGIVIN